jgi:hypothetical protein
MNQELREHLGKVAYAQSSFAHAGSWEYASEELREEYRRVAEASAQELAGMLVSPIQQMFQAFLSIMDSVNKYDSNT